MRHWWLVFAVTLYLSLDVANPLMPGAVSFGIDNSVELRQAERARVPHDLVTPAPSLDRVSHAGDEVATNLPRATQQVPTGSPRVWRVRSALLAPSEDPLTLRS